MPPFTPKPGFRFTPAPLKEALDFFRAKGFKVGLDHRDVWREEHAVSFTVAKAMSLGVLTAIRGEIGHQMHYRAGSPSRPRGFPALTEYGSSYYYEWHAKHFTAWVLNRAELAEWGPEVAQYFDDLIEKAMGPR